MFDDLHISPTEIARRSVTDDIALSSVIENGIGTAVGLEGTV